jgi:hypothetical protein
MQSNATQNAPPRPTNLQNPQPAPNNPAPVAARDADRGRLAFERTLERAIQSDSYSNDRGNGDTQRAVDDRPDRDSQSGGGQHSDKDEQDRREVGSDGVVVVRTPIPNFVAGNNPFVAASAARLSQEQIATLQRMAAAIAEVGKSGIDAKMTIQFSGMNGIAEGAILGRDARGGLTVHLVGAPPHMTPANAQMLRADLMQRLLKRKLNVSDVDFIDTNALTERAVKQGGMAG